MMIEWEKDINWKIHTSDGRFYIMRDHNWSFAAWELEKLRGRIKERSLLVHVDAHLDDCTDGVLVENLLDANTTEEIIEVSKSYDRSKGCAPESNLMHIDNFIWAALARKTVEEVIYVSRQKQNVVTLEDLHNDGSPASKITLSKLPIDCNYKHKRFYNIVDFFNQFSKHEFQEYVGVRTAILDLDIDTFNESDIMFEPFLTPLHEVREQVQDLMSFYPWDMITIAISPEYCGGILEAELLFETVLKEIGIEYQNTMKW
jgi:hypothetical protein